MPAQAAYTVNVTVLWTVAPVEADVTKNVSVTEYLPGIAALIVTNDVGAQLEKFITKP